eukprot:TRINITY_DN98931_c0_g1_i1.p1 TRINITY_DN98931_c0_g1~~TRINITY_DN98931_c0_g1_i1.p1  ORF type:complete len:414 (+),score=102.49 TRINITY_DN98931_c0_g1_i1:31-1272(+)
MSSRLSAAHACGAAFAAAAVLTVLVAWSGRRRRSARRQGAEDEQGGAHDQQAAAKDEDHARASGQESASFGVASGEGDAPQLASEEHAAGKQLQPLPPSAAPALAPSSAQRGQWPFSPHGTGGASMLLGPAGGATGLWGPTSPSRRSQAVMSPSEKRDLDMMFRYQERQEGRPPSGVDLTRAKQARQRQQLKAAGISSAAPAEALPSAEELEVKKPRKKRRRKPKVQMATKHCSTPSTASGDAENVEVTATGQETEEAEVEVQVVSPGSCDILKDVAAEPQGDFLLSAPSRPRRQWADLTDSSEEDESSIMLRPALRAIFGTGVAESTACQQRAPAAPEVARASTPPEPVVEEADESESDESSSDFEAAQQQMHGWITVQTRRNRGLRAKLGEGTPSANGLEVHLDAPTCRRR